MTSGRLPITGVGEKRIDEQVKPDRHATLEAIARAAGVHVSTVSRVLNAGPDTAGRAASQQTAAKIHRLAGEMRYRPNPLGVGLRTQRTQSIAVLVPRLADIVLATIYEGIEAAATKHGYTTFVANTHDNPQERRERAEMALSARVDGLIFGDADADSQFLDDLAGHGTPFVLVSRHSGQHPSITCDDYLGGCMAATHLLEMGHTQVAVIAGEPYASTGIDRTQGFLDTYEKGGINLDSKKVVHSRFDAPGGRDAAQRLLRTRPYPTAIFVVNDFAAIGLLGVLRDKGLQAGQDIAVVGFNDTPLARELPVPLTSVRSPMSEMGAASVDLLIALLAGEPAHSRKLMPELMVRASSNPTLRQPEPAESVRASLHSPKR